jgi:hypothetical protein
MRSTNPSVSSYLRIEYLKILKQIIPNEPSNRAEREFDKLWNKGRHEEFINILPSAIMLDSGSSNYSDGIIIGEAVRNNTCTIHGQLTFRNRAHANITAAFVTNANGAPPVSTEAFVRLGHIGPAMFWRAFNALSTVVPAGGTLSEQAQFKNLVATMLGLITIPNPAGAGPRVPLTVANLPSFP